MNKLIAGALLLLAGCAGPEYVYCSGKGSVTLQGFYGGGITLDCPQPMTLYKGALPPQILPVAPGTPVAPK